MTRAAGALDRLHRDRERLLREQLDRIQVQVEERRVLSTAVQAAIDEELLLVGTMLLQLAPGPFSQEAPEQRRDRLSVHRDRQVLTSESREESRRAWQDVQKLEEERRLVERELTSTEQRKERLEELLR